MTKTKNCVLLERCLAIALYKMQSENFLLKRHLCVAVLVELWKTTEQVERLHIPLNVSRNKKNPLASESITKIV